jgi:hypothetical protein
MGLSPVHSFPFRTNFSLILLARFNTTLECSGFVTLVYLDCNPAAL